MNLSELIDDNGLQQDEWSLTKPKFGKEGQLEVVGWSGRTGTHKFYILKCGVCSKDSELFGEGYFKCTKGNITSGQLPCGCSKRPAWSKDQYSVMCSRKAKELGYLFLGFEGTWKGVYTKVKLLCDEHGDWITGCIDNLLKETGCPECRIDNLIKPDDVMIKSFFASKAFHPETKFWRSDRKNTQGIRAYWFMFCPVCGETGESTSVNLQRGHRSCACNTQNQQESYINWIIDSHGTVVAIKFGIASDSKRRVKQQNSKSVYTIKQHSVYQFPDVTSCKKAERVCKQELECGIVLKRDMPDGWTETTWVYNLDKIIEIYERGGGIRVCLQGNDVVEIMII